MDEFLYHQFGDIDRRHWWFLARREIVLTMLRDRLPAAGASTRRILEIGCGGGGMLEPLREFGRVTGMDMSEDALAYCRTKVGSEVELRRGDLPDDLPRDASYDVIAALDVLEHLADPVTVLHSIRASMRPGGLLLCTVPAFRFLWGPHDDLNHHLRRYGREELRGHLEAGGFTVERLSFFNTWLFPVVAGVRVGRRALGLADGPPKSDFVMPKPWLSRALARLFATGARVMRHLSFPVGVSLLAVCRVPGASRVAGQSAA